MIIALKKALGQYEGEEDEDVAPPPRRFTKYIVDFDMDVDIGSVKSEICRVGTSAFLVIQAKMKTRKETFTASADVEVEESDYEGWSSSSEEVE